MVVMTAIDGCFSKLEVFSRIYNDSLGKVATEMAFGQAVAGVICFLLRSLHVHKASEPEGSGAFQRSTVNLRYGAMLPGLRGRVVSHDAEGPPHDRLRAVLGRGRGLKAKQERRGRYSFHGR